MGEAFSASLMKFTLSISLMGLHIIRFITLLLAGFLSNKHGAVLFAAICAFDVPIGVLLGVIFLVNYLTFNIGLILANQSRSEDNAKKSLKKAKELYYELQQYHLLVTEVDEEREAAIKAIHTLHESKLQQRQKMREAKQASLKNSVILTIDDQRTLNEATEVIHQMRLYLNTYPEFLVEEAKRIAII